MTLSVSHPSILDIAPYKAGENHTKGSQQPIKLSSNESAFGPSPKAIEAYQQTAPSLHRYPDSNANTLRKALAKHYQLNEHNIICGAGSDEIISLLCQAYAGKGKEVIYSQYGFLMYAISAKATGAKTIEVPAKANLSADIDAIIQHITSNTAIIFLASPNNPTGDYITKEQLHYLHKNIPSHVLLVIDGAYAEYIQANDYSAGQELVEQYDNVVMTRTFSKIYGLGGLRIGWGYAPNHITDIYHRIRGPFNVSSPSIAAATAAINDHNFIQKAIEHNQYWKQQLTQQLSQRDYVVNPSAGNFILVDCSKKPGGAEAVNQNLQSHGIIVRQMQGYGLPQSLRITIGNEQENEQLLKIL